MEVATALLLEVQYGWKADMIGYALGIVFGTTVLLGCAILVVRGRLVQDLHLMFLLAGVGTFGVILFFDFKRFGVLKSAWPLLIGDAFNFSCMFQLAGFMDGLAAQAAVPDAFWNLKNYMLLKKVAIQIPRAITPPVVRWIIQHLGRHWASLR